GYSNSGGTITGSNFTNQASYLNQAVADATAASNAAAALSRQTTGLTVSGGVSSGVLTNDTTAISLNGTSGGISGASGQTYVLNIADLILSGAGAVLTLSGSNSTNYVINVNR